MVIHLANALARSVGLRNRAGTGNSVCYVWPGEPGAIADARHHVRETVLAWGFAGAADDVTLCVSELASNAVKHSDSRLPGGTFRVRASGGPDSVRIEVTDSGGHWLGTQAAETSECGRGLAIIGALAADWGVSTRLGSRTVWCLLAAKSR